MWGKIDDNEYDYNAKVPMPGKSAQRGTIRNPFLAGLFMNMMEENETDHGTGSGSGEGRHTQTDAMMQTLITQTQTDTIVQTLSHRQGGNRYD